MPSARLVIAETAATRRPAWRATIASGTVDMPTASAPRVRKARISAGVSKLGPGDREVDALAERDAEPPAARVQRRAQRGVVGVARGGKRGPSASSLGPASGLKPVRLMWSVSAIEAARGRPRGAASRRRWSARATRRRRRAGRGRASRGRRRARPRRGARGPEHGDGTPPASPSTRGRRGPRRRAAGSRAARRRGARSRPATASATAPRPEPSTRPTRGARPARARRRLAAACRAPSSGRTSGSKASGSSSPSWSSRRRPSGSAEVDGRLGAGELGQPLAAAAAGRADVELLGHDGDRA